MTPRYWGRATKELSSRDPILRELVLRLGPAQLRSRGEPFVTLMRSIVGQQISVKAADSVWKRLTETINTLEPTAIIAAKEQTLRSCGLSGRKAIYLKNLAGRFIDGSINHSRFRFLDDEAIIHELSKVNGIGRWTAEMFLIFHLLRPNVLPLNDIGLQRALALHYGKGHPLPQRKLSLVTALWVPWCSVATWYLWRSLDPVPVEY